MEKVDRVVGRPSPPYTISASDTCRAEVIHAVPEIHALRIAVWTSSAPDREGHERSFLEEVRTPHVVPPFRAADELQRQVYERIRAIAAEDLVPWCKLGNVVVPSFGPWRVSCSPALISAEHAAYRRRRNLMGLQRCGAGVRVITSPVTSEDVLVHPPIARVDPGECCDPRLHATEAEPRGTSEVINRPQAGCGGRDYGRLVGAVRDLYVLSRRARPRTRLRRVLETAAQPTCCHFPWKWRTATAASPR